MSQVRIWVHCVWGTKNRAPFMQNKSRRISLFKHFKSYAKDKDIYLDFVNGVSDHVHCLVSLKRDQSIAHVVKSLKGATSHYAVSQRLFAPDFDWADDYYAVSVSHSQTEAVRNYLKKQEKHHERKTYLEECQEFIEKFGFQRMMD
jgi:putative transposase